MRAARLFGKIFLEIGILLDMHPAIPGEIHTTSSSHVSDRRCLSQVMYSSDGQCLGQVMLSSDKQCMGQVMYRLHNALVSSSLPPSLAVRPDSVWPFSHILTSTSLASSSLPPSLDHPEKPINTVHIYVMYISNPEHPSVCYSVFPSISLFTQSSCNLNQNQKL